MPIIYIQYESVPLDSSSDYQETGGAIINCWVKALSIEDAKNKAVIAIEDNKWKIVQLEEVFEVNENTYENNDESLDFYHQAELDGECYVYHKWPNELQEEDRVH